jgi:hypothetical protein
MKVGIKNSNNGDIGKSKAIELVFILAMLLPFAFKSVLAYIYWIAIVTSYLLYLGWRWRV